jgi:hypothetical protein
MRAKPVTVAGVLVAAVATSACGQKPRTFDTKVEILRVRPISRDPKTNEVLTVDVEVSFLDCPGEQRKMSRGDKAFAACIMKHQPKEQVAAKLWYGKVDDDHFGNQIVKLAECDRKPDPRDEASYEVIQDCEDIIVNGVNVGVHCDRKPSKELLAKCPWFKKR